jgi:hypothetical protein
LANYQKPTEHLSEAVEHQATIKKLNFVGGRTEGQGQQDKRRCASEGKSPIT